MGEGLGAGGWGLEGFPKPGAEPRPLAASGAAARAGPRPRGLLRVQLPDRSCPASNPREKKASLSRPGEGRRWGVGGGGAAAASSTGEGRTKRRRGGNWPGRNGRRRRNVGGRKGTWEGRTERGGERGGPVSPGRALFLGSPRTDLQDLDSSPSP